MKSYGEAISLLSLLLPLKKLRDSVFSEEENLAPVMPSLHKQEEC